MLRLERLAHQPLRRWSCWFWRGRSSSDSGLYAGGSSCFDARALLRLLAQVLLVLRVLVVAAIAAAEELRLGFVAAEHGALHSSLFTRRSWIHFRRSIPQPQMLPAGRDEELNYIEQAFGDKYPPVSTVTFFRGDISAVQSSLPKKVASIIVANKWLDGVMHRSGKKLMLRVPDRVVDANARHYVEAPRQPAVGAELANDPVALERLLSPYFVAKGVGAGPLFRVTLIPTRPGEFAVVMSLHHGVADGATFYAIYAMLGSVPAYSMDARRVPEFTLGSVQQMIGPKHAAWQVSPIMIMVWIATMMCGCGTKHPTALHLVNDEWVEEQKRRRGRRRRGGEGAVSRRTTSHALRRAHRRLFVRDDERRLLEDGALPARRPAATLAGCSTPRTRLARRHPPLTQRDGRRAAGERQPSLLETLDLNLIHVTNWASLNKTPLKLPGCTQTLHLPIMSPGSMPRGYSIIIFQATEERLGVRVFTSAENCARLA